MRALYCVSDDGTNILLGREAIPDRTNPKPVDDTRINLHYVWRFITALLNLPSARMRTSLRCMMETRFTSLYRGQSYFQHPGYMAHIASSITLV